MIPSTLTLRVTKSPLFPCPDVEHARGATALLLTHYNETAPRSPPIAVRRFLGWTFPAKATHNSRFFLLVPTWEEGAKPPPSPSAPGDRQPTLLGHAAFLACPHLSCFLSLFYAAQGAPTGTSTPLHSSSHPPRVPPGPARKHDDEHQPNFLLFISTPTYRT